MVATLSAIVDGSSLNIFQFRLMAFALIFGPLKLKTTITRIVIKKDHPKLIKNGISAGLQHFQKQNKARFLLPKGILQTD